MLHLFRFVVAQRKIAILSAAFDLSIGGKKKNIFKSIATG